MERLQIGAARAKLLAVSAECFKIARMAQAFGFDR
jgi:hypothetical protein